MLTRLLLLIAAFAVLAVSASMAWQSRRFSPRELPHDFRTPGLALQFATDQDDVTEIVGPAQPEHPDRALMRSQITRDRSLIASYALFFVLAGIWTTRRQDIGWVRRVGWVGLAAGLAAAGFDLWENAALLDALNAPPSVPTAANAAYWKWSFFFLAMLFASPAAWRKDGPGAAASVVFGLAGFAGLFVLWLPDHPTSVDKFAAGFGLALLLMLLTPLDDRIAGGFVGWLGRLVRGIDERLRFFDLWANRTADGLMGKDARHTFVAVVVPALLTFFIVNGPALRPTWRLALATIAAFAGAAACWGLLEFGARRRAFQFDLVAQCLLIAGIAGFVWWIAPKGGERHVGFVEGTAIPYEALPYQHVLIVMTALLAAAILIGSVFAKYLFGSERGRKSVPRRLQEVELFVSLPDPPTVTGWMFLLAAFQAVTSSPARVLFAPAFFALFVEREWVTPVFVLAGVGNLILLAFASLDARFSGSWKLLHRVFFSGWSALVSVVVIVLGICRVADVQYVSTVFDGARNYTLGGYLLAAYALTWWFDYWMSSAAAIRLLDLLGGRGGADDAKVAYPIVVKRKTRVPADGRVMQSHGAGRVIVLHDHEIEPNPFFHSYGLTEVVDALQVGLVAKDPVRADLDWVKWRLAAHMLMTSGVVVLLFGVAGWLLHRLPQEAQIGPPAGGAARAPLDLASTVFPPGACAGQTPVIGIAASGGGTRAALYTTAVLEQLSKLNQLRNVTIVSGVSGGGAALAYFASHRSELLAGGEAWNAFFTAMKEPYIEDVIDGSGEWRIATGHRLGHLLADSFDRRWGRQQNMEDVQDVGLILNSAIAGRFVRKRCEAAGSIASDGKRCDDPSQPIGVLERKSGRPGLSDVAGGRVVYTNLDLKDHFGNAALIEREPERASRDTRLPIFVVNGGHVPLAAAAAANANFPPVFSNAAIDRDHDLRLWVTDGGAIDNRGTETLLMAIRVAAAAAAKTDSPKCAKLPPIHIVEVEASAFSDSYSQDRGLGSVMAAGTAFASQLDAELIEDIRQQAGLAVRFHYLPMPRLLRQSGSFGTHWMMQERITVCRDPRCRQSMVLEGDDVVKVLRALNEHSQSAGSSNADLALAFILRDEKEWTRNTERLSDCLSGKTSCDLDATAAAVKADR